MTIGGSSRKETGYDKAVDIISHSTGTCITRYFLEVMDGTHHRALVSTEVCCG